MILELIKTYDNKLMPANRECFDKIDEIASGKSIFVEYKPKRNYEFHKKAFALLNMIFTNQERYENLSDLLVEFKLKAGHYDEHITTKGILIYVPKSISFAEMDEIEFNEIYKKFLNIAFLHFSFTNEMEAELLKFI